MSRIVWKALLVVEFLSKCVTCHGSWSKFVKIIDQASVRLTHWLNLGLKQLCFPKNVSTIRLPFPDSRKVTKNPCHMAGSIQYPNTIGSSHHRSEQVHGEDGSADTTPPRAVSLEISMLL